MKYGRKKDIEVEVRSFLDLGDFRRLKCLFDSEAKLEDKISDETVYFTGVNDLRIRRDDNNAYLILKKGKIHDKHRQETEIVVDRKDFLKLENFLISLGFKVEIRWQRKRIIYNWQGVKVFLDNTKGYGRIIELEKMASEEEKEKIHTQLLQKLKFLQIKITPKSEFNASFLNYKKNWRSLLKRTVDV